VAIVPGSDRNKQRRGGAGSASQQPAVSRAEQRAAAQQAAAAARVRLLPPWFDYRLSCNGCDVVMLVAKYRILC
jgi:hypothetical protein